MWQIQTRKSNWLNIFFENIKQESQKRKQWFKIQNNTYREDLGCDGLMTALCWAEKRGNQGCHRVKYVATAAACGRGLLLCRETGCRQFKLVTGTDWSAAEPSITCPSLVTTARIDWELLVARLILAQLIVHCDQGYSWDNQLVTWVTSMISTKIELDHFRQIHSIDPPNPYLDI